MAARKTKRKKTQQKRKSTRKKAAGSRQTHVLLAILFLLAFLLGSMILLSKLHELLPEKDTSPPPPPVVHPLEKQVLLDDIQVEVESALYRSGLSLKTPPCHLGAGVTLMDIRGSGFTPTVLASLDERLSRISPQISLQRTSGSKDLKIRWDKTTCFILRFHSQPSPAPPAHGPRVAIIMDDLGRDVQTIRKLIKIDIPITLAILPWSRHAAQTATLGNRYKREILIHLPMEPVSYPTANPGPEALFANLSASEIHRRIEGYLERVPYAVGGNNHMGSRFTANREGMSTVARILKNENLFFVDSLTTGKSVAFAEARKAGVPSAVRDVFLDNVQDVKSIRKEIRTLADLATRQGHAIGICHPYPQTIEALRLEEPRLKSAGIEVVNVSDLLVH